VLVRSAPDEEIASAGPLTTSPRTTGPRVRWHRGYARLLVLSDVIVLIWVFSTAHIAWAVTVGADLETGSPYDAGPIVVSLVLMTLWLAALSIAGTREPIVLGAGPDEYKRIVTASMMWFALMAFAGYMIRFEVPRSYVAVSVAFGLVLLMLSRWSWRQWLVVRRQRGEMSSRTLVVGTRGAVERIIGVVGVTSHFGYRLVGVCVPSAGDGSESVAGLPIVGALDDVVSVIADGFADTVLVTSTDATHADMVRRLGWDLEPYDVDIIVAPSLANVAGPRVHIRPVAGLPLLHVEEPSYRGATRWGKSLFDRAGSMALLIVGLPIFLATAVAIKITSPGPVFYRQERVGRDGRVFRMIKFRSMVVDADQMLTDLEADSGNEVMFKMRDDPRVTRVGRFIRRTSIDELPQLLNVLKGDMSLVGPRPPLLSEFSGYGTDARRRLLVRPGMTGLWQVSGRSNLDWEETVRLDLYYVENWSLIGDLLILWKTLRAVISSEGAY